MEKENILLLGDSITAAFDVEVLLPSLHIRNEGVSGDSTVECLERLSPEWFEGQQPYTHVFLCIGTNDLARERTDVQILANVAAIVARLSDLGVPSACIHLTSIFPTRDNAPRPNARIEAYNEKLRAYAQQGGMHYFDLASMGFKDEQGQLRAEFTNDSLHLTLPAYQLWAKSFLNYLTKN